MAGGINTYGYVGGNPVNNYDPDGLDCVAVNDNVTCTAPGGPTVSFPRPKDWPDKINSDSTNYHDYNKYVDAGDADIQCLRNYIKNNTTPGNPNAATPEGVANNATPSQLSVFGSSPVRSYSSTSSYGEPVIINVTQPGHPLHPGYVARTVARGASANIINNFGEGAGFLQAEWLPFNDTLINDIWYGLSQEAIDACSCED